jgi:retron-type reverse transcriptase
MSLVTPEKIRSLQRKLYRKAKAEPAFRFYVLYDKICREDILRHAYALARDNAGAAGVDGMTFAQIEASGVEAWLAGLREELVSKTYRPDPVRRVMIPKPNGGGERALGIPTIRDRVIQTAAKLVLEPIFEADFEDNAYGYRPARGAVDAVKEVHRLICRGYTDVVDADLSRYLDRASYCTQIHEAWLKRSGCEQLSLRRRPFLRPRLTWMASMSPRLTRCHTVCRETPSRRMVWYMVRYPSGASSATRARKSSVRRIRQGAPGVSCSPAMMPSLSQR